MARHSLIAFTALLLVTTASRAETVEKIVITASRVPIAADQTGSAISVIDGATLQAHQIAQVFDALREVPGVEVSRTGTVGSLSQIRIRGAEAGHALVLIDGVRANDPAQSGAEFNFAHLLTAAIDRIEVLRGPQSALWGADALAGVINVVTVAPQSGFYARGRAEYGSFDSKEISGLVNAGGESYGAVFDAAWLDTGGINIARTGHEADGYRNLSAGFRARAELAPNITLSASLHHVAARSETDTSDFIGFLSIPIDSGDFTKFATTYGRVEARAVLFGGAVETIAGATLTRTEAEDFTSAFSAPFAVAFNDRVKGGETKFDVQTNLRWDGWGAQQRVSVLAETMRDTFDMLRLDLPSADQNQHQRNSGIAGEYWIGLNENIFISLGARHDWNERFADSTTWRATVSASMPSAHMRLHASAGTGVKNPDFFELFGFFPAPAFVGNPNLKPERSFGYDAGVEWHAMDGMVLDVTYFHADLEDEIFTDFFVFPNTARNAPGHSKRQGVEASANADLGRGFTLDAAYTYLDSQQSNGEAEVRRPHHIASLNLDYRFVGARGLVNLGVDFHGSQRDTAFLNAPPFSMPVTLGSYTLVRLAGSYGITDNIALTARIENALDAHYEEVFGYRTRGFGAFIGISAKL